MLTAYFDESGHSKDPRSHFCGIGGLIADSASWDSLIHISRGDPCRTDTLKASMDVYATNA